MERALFDRWSARLESALARLELRFSLVVAAALVASAIYLLAVLYTFPFDPSAQIYVQWYIAKTLDPFVANPFSNRVLNTALAYMLGGGKASLAFVNHAFAWLLLFSTYFFYRKQGWNHLLALAPVALIGLTIPTLMTAWWTFFPDSCTYFFVFLAFAFRARIVWSWLFFALALFNHESAMFALPALALIQAWGDGKWRWGRSFRVSFVAATAAGIYLAFFFWVTTKSDVGSGAILSRFLSDPLFNLRAVEENYYLAVFSAFKLAWLVPVAAAAVAWREGWNNKAWIVIAAVFFTVVSTAVTSDVTRQLGIGFLALLIAVEVLKDRYDQRALGGVLLCIAAINMFVPQMAVFGHTISSMHSVVHRLVAWLAELI